LGRVVGGPLRSGSPDRHLHPGRRDVSGLRTILACHPGQSQGYPALSGKVASKGEIAFAKFADKTPHIVLSRTLNRVSWKTTRIVRDVEDIRRMKQQPGKDMYAVGGATLVSSLMNLSCS